MPPRKPPPPDPVSDEEWDRRSLELEDPDSGDRRHKLRQLADRADVLLEMAESRERWAVFRAIAKKFVIGTAALVAAMSAFKDEIRSLWPWGGP